MEYLFLVFVLISILWSTIQKLRAAKQRQEAGEGAQKTEERPVTLSEILRRELERRQKEMAEELEAGEAMPPEELPTEPEVLREEPEPVPKPEAPLRPVERAATQEPPATPVVKPRKAEPGWQLDAGTAKRGIVMAEILGPCRAMRPHGL